MPYIGIRDKNVLMHLHILIYRPQLRQTLYCTHALVNSIGVGGIDNIIGFNISFQWRLEKKVWYNSIIYSSN